MKETLKYIALIVIFLAILAGSALLEFYIFIWKVHVAKDILSQ